jgi:hypothetical protein
LIAARPPDLAFNFLRTDYGHPGRGIVDRVVINSANETEPAESRVFPELPALAWAGINGYAFRTFTIVGDTK